MLSLHEGDNLGWANGSLGANWKAWSPFTQAFSPSLPVFGFFPQLLSWRTFLLLCRRLSPSPGLPGGPVPQCALSPSHGWYPACLPVVVPRGTTSHAGTMRGSCFRLPFPVSIRVASALVSFAAFNILWPVPLFSPKAPSFLPTQAAPPSPWADARSSSRVAAGPWTWTCSSPSPSTSPVLFFLLALLMIWVKKVPESRRTLGTGQAQAPVCFQRAFAVTGVPFILFGPDAATFLDAALGCPLCGPGRGLSGKHKPESKTAGTAECHYARRWQPTKNALNNDSCYREANEKKKWLAEPPASAACLLPRRGHESGAGSVWPLGLLASRSPSPDKMGLGNQLPIIVSGLSHAVHFTVQGRRQTARLDLGGWTEWKE